MKTNNKCCATIHLKRRKFWFVIDYDSKNNITTGGNKEETGMNKTSCALVNCTTPKSVAIKTGTE